MSFLNLPAEIRFKIYIMLIETHLLTQAREYYMGVGRCPPLRLGDWYSEEHRKCQRPPKIDFRILWVCRQVYEEMLSTIASHVPLNLGYECVKKVIRLSDPTPMEKIIRRDVPHWYYSKVRKVCCWSDSATAPAALDRYPLLDTVLLTRLRCLPSGPVIGKSPWTKDDVETPEAMVAVRRESCKLHAAEAIAFDKRYPNRTFSLELELRFGHFGGHIRTSKDNSYYNQHYRKSDGTIYVTGMTLV